MSDGLWGGDGISKGARFRIRVSTHHNDKSSNTNHSKFHQLTNTIKKQVCDYFYCYEKSSNTNHSKFHQLTNTIKKQVCDYFYWCKWSGFQLHTLLNLFSTCFHWNFWVLNSFYSISVISLFLCFHWPWLLWFRSCCFEKLCKC